MIIVCVGTQLFAVEQTFRIVCYCWWLHSHSARFSVHVGNGRRKHANDFVAATAAAVMAVAVALTSNR